MEKCMDMGFKRGKMEQLMKDILIEESILVYKN
jgi:hypothetical protein